MVGLSLIAVFAIAAIAASSASALEWGRCEAKAGGNYTGPNCGKTEKAKPKGTGTYEWLKASQVASKRVAKGKSANVPFTGGNVGSGGVLTADPRSCQTSEAPHQHRVTRQKCKELGGTESEAGSPLGVECESESNSGEAAANNKVVNVNVTFKGCKLLGAFPCTSAGAEEGEVKVNPLKGALGWINKAAKEVGVVLEPAKKHGLFTTFNCLSEFQVGVGNKTEGAFYTNSGEPGGPTTTPAEETHGGYDEIISPITPVNKNTSTFEQVYTTTPENPFYNLPHRLAGKHISALEVAPNPTAPGSKYAWSAAGEELTNLNTSEEEAEIKA